MQIFRKEKYPVSVSIQLFVLLGLSSTLPENLVQEISVLFFCFSSMAERVKRHEQERKLSCDAKAKELGLYIYYN